MEEKKATSDGSEQQQALSPEQTWWLALSIVLLFLAGYLRGVWEDRKK
jgi:cobaltochelatase CobN